MGACRGLGLEAVGGRLAFGEGLGWQTVGGWVGKRVLVGGCRWGERVLVGRWYVGRERV